MSSQNARPICRPIALRIEERSLVDISELLQADRIELMGSSVTFYKQLPHGDGMRWAAELGDYLVSAGELWRVTTQSPTTIPAFIA